MEKRADPIRPYQIGKEPDAGFVLQVAEEATMYAPAGANFNSYHSGVKSKRFMQTKGLIGLCKRVDCYLMLTKYERKNPWRFHRYATPEDIAIFVACKLSRDREYLNTTLGYVRIWIAPEIDNQEPF